MAADSESTPNEQRKARNDDKEEAARRGMTVKELRKERKKSAKRKKKREADDLDTSEHKRDIKRMRAYSNNDLTTTTENDAKRRTRSMDTAEEKQVVAAEDDEPTQQSVTEWRKEHSITLTGHGTSTAATADFADPFRAFSDAPFADRIQTALLSAGFTTPTPIQSQAWPVALQSNDMICIAKTGSGKTCAFLLPSFQQYLDRNERKQGYCKKPVMLVLAPTRELSVQIMQEAVKFGRSVGIRSICCYGGASKHPQIAALQRGVECIIATPGRLNDLIEMKRADLSGIQFLVLDEADRMLDMGFEPQIRSIVKHVPVERQTMLFSATWPREIQALAHDFLRNPVQINVGQVNALVANKDIQQTILVCSEGEKLDKLTEILTDLSKQDEEDASASNGPTNPAGGGGKRHAKVIVFVAKKVSCNDLANRLWDDGFAVDSLHGDRPQWERTRVMGAFKSGVLRMLIATDVAARGLDVKDVGAVVNYDMPNAVEDYVHRIGRTGRAGAKGCAYTFFTASDKKCATRLVQVLEKSGQDVPPELQAMVPRPRFYGGGGGRGRGGGRGGGRGYMMTSGGRGRGYMNSSSSMGGRGYHHRNGGHNSSSYGRGGRAGRGGYARGGRGFGGRGGYRR